MSRMTDDLNLQNIKLKHHNPGNQKVLCPRCSHSRKHKSDPCLSVTIDGDTAVYNCHNCFWSGGAGNVAGKRDDAPKKDFKKPATPTAQPGDFPKSAKDMLTKRGITEEVIKRNKLFWDSARHAVCFPYYENGGLANIKYRTLDKKFQLEAGAKLLFYGIDDIKDSEEIIIVEGEFDKLALEVCGKRNVVSVPNGAPARIKEGDPSPEDKLFAYLVNAEKQIKAAKKIIIAVDDDPAGENLRYELIRRIGAHKCWVVKFPHKDANGCLEHLGPDVTLDALNEATPCPIKGLYTAAEFQDALIEYYQTGMKAGVPTGFSNLDALWTVKPGETTVLTGVPNKGKSEFVDALMMNLAKNENWQIAVFSPEHKKEQHVTKLIEKVIGMPTGPNDPNRMPIEKFLDGMAWVDKHFQFIIADNYDDMPHIDWVLEKATSAVYRRGIKFFLIDPWNELQLPEPKRGVSETDHIGHNIAKVMRWGKRHDVHNLIIAHPAKIIKDKDGEERIPGLYDIHGSAHWTNKPDNGLVIHRRQDAASLTEIYVRKIRDKHVGTTGDCNLKYEKRTGLFSVPAKAVKYLHEQPGIETHDERY